MNPNKIILHHSLTKDSDTVSVGAIRNYHINVNKWSDIGYHFLIEKMRGQTEIIVGRMLDRIGAHCRGYNYGSIGICFIGNFDKDYPSQESWGAGIELAQYLIRQYNIKTILGHTELNSCKSCPGKNFNLDKFRKDVGL